MLTPEEAAELNQLRQQFGVGSAAQAPQSPAPTDDRGWFTGHALPVVANFAQKTSRALGEGAYGAANLIFTDKTADERGYEADERRRLWEQVQMAPAPARHFGDTATDFVGDVAPQVAALLLPGGIASAGAKTLGAGPVAAGIIGDVAAGAYSGVGQSPEEAALQAGEFGLGGAAMRVGGRRFGTLGRIAIGSGVNAAAGAGVELARGNDLSSDEALTHIATNAAFPAAMIGGPALVRRFGRQAPVGEAPAPRQTNELGEPIDNPEVSTSRPETQVFDEPSILTQQEEELARQLHRQSQGLSDLELAPRRLAGERDGYIPEPIPEDTGLRLAGQGAPATIEPPSRIQTLEEAINNRAVVSYNGKPGALELGGDGVYFRNQLGESERVYGKVPNATIAEVEGLSFVGEGPRRPFARQPIEQVEAQGQPGPYNTQITPDTAPGTGRRLQRIDRAREGATLSAPVQYIGSGVGGAALGAYADDENRLRGAALGFVGGLGLAGGVRRLGGARQSLTKAADEQMRANPTVAGGVTRFAEKNLNLNKEDAVLRIEEQASGAQSFYEKKIAKAIKEAGDFRAKLTPAQASAFNTFLNSAGDTVDEAALIAAGLPKEAEKLVLLVRKAKREGQVVAAGSHTDPRKKATVAGTMGTYFTTAYKTFLAPNQHTFDPAKIDAVVAERMRHPQFDGIDPKIKAGVVEDDLRAHLNELKESGSFGGGGKTRSDRTLWVEKKALSSDELNTLTKLRSDPRLSAADQTVIADMLAADGLRPADQVFLSQVSKYKGLTDAERAAIGGIAKKTVLSKAYRDLLGEVTDPWEAEMLTTRKLLSEMRASTMISKFMTESGDKGRFAMTKQEHRNALLAAKNAGDNAQYDFLRTYVESPESGLAGLSRGTVARGVPKGMMIQRQVADALQAGAAHQGINTGDGGWLAILNRYPKAVFTRYNPAAWTHNAVGTVIQSVAMRIRNPAKLMTHWKAMRADPKLEEEVIRNGIINSHAGVEFNRAARDMESIINPTKWQRVKGALNKVDDVVGEGYGKVDQVTRVAGYFENKPRFLKEGTAKGLTGDALESYAQNKATEFVNSHSVNYSQASRGVKLARNIPFTNAFITYTTENLKILKNLSRELLNGDTAEKINAAIALSTMLAAPIALKAMFSGKLDDKESEDFERAEKLGPAYMRGRTSIPLGNDEKGHPGSFNAGPWTPSGDLIQTARNILNGDWEALAETNPLVGLTKTPALNIISEQVSGQEKFTGRKLKTAGDRAANLAKNLSPSWLPPYGHAARKLGAGFSENDEGKLGITDARTGRTESPTSAILSTFGASVSRTNLRLLEKRIKRESDEEISGAKQEMRQVLRSNVTAPEKDKARKLFAQRKLEAQRKLKSKLSK